jgi:hypothetical protein
VPVKNDPPKIFTSEKRAILVLYEGEPIFRPISGTDLTFAVNTSWDVINDKAGSRYYLLAADHWLVSSNPKGTWSAASSLPASFPKIPGDGNWQRVRKGLSAPPFSAGQRGTMRTLFCARAHAALAPRPVLVPERLRSRRFARELLGPPQRRHPLQPPPCR